MIDKKTLGKFGLIIGLVSLVVVFSLNISSAGTYHLKENFENYPISFDQSSDSKAVPGNWSGGYNWDSSAISYGVDDDNSLEGDQLFLFKHTSWDVSSTAYAYIQKDFDFSRYENLRLNYSFNTNGAGFEVFIDDNSYFHTVSNTTNESVNVNVYNVTGVHTLKFQINSNGNQNNQSLRIDNIGFEEPDFSPNLENITVSDNNIIDSGTVSWSMTVYNDSPATVSENVAVAISYKDTVPYFRSWTSDDTYWNSEPAITLDAYESKDLSGDFYIDNLGTYNFLFYKDGVLVENIPVNSKEYLGDWKLSDFTVPDKVNIKYENITYDGSIFENGGGSVDDWVRVEIRDYNSTIRDTEGFETYNDDFIDGVGENYVIPPNNWNGTFHTIDTSYERVIPEIMMAVDKEQKLYENKSYHFRHHSFPSEEGDYAQIWKEFNLENSDTLSFSYNLRQSEPENCFGRVEVDIGDNTIYVSDSNEADFENVSLDISNFDSVENVYFRFELGDGEHDQHLYIDGINFSGIDYSSFDLIDSKKFPFVLDDGESFSFSGSEKPEYTGSYSVEAFEGGTYNKIDNETVIVYGSGLAPNLEYTNVSVNPLTLESVGTVNYEFKVANTGSERGIENFSVSVIDASNGNSIYSKAFELDIEPGDYLIEEGGIYLESNGTYYFKFKKDGAVKVQKTVNVSKVSGNYYLNDINAPDNVERLRGIDYNFTLVENSGGYIDEPCTVRIFDNDGLKRYEEVFDVILDPNQNKTFSDTVRFNEGGRYTIKVFNKNDVVLGSRTVIVSEQYVDIPNFPEKVSNWTNLSVEVSKILICSLIIILATLGTVVVAGKVDAKVNNWGLLLGFINYPIVGFLIYLGWMPLWIPVMLVFVTLVYLGSKVARIGGDG